MEIDGIDFPEDWDYSYDDADVVVWVPVTWLLRNTDDSIDYGMNVYDEENDYRWWEYILRNKCRDTGMGHLVESIMTHGFAEEGAIGWWQGQITEGHHRLCAAILLCLDTVPISKWGGNRNTFGVSAHENYDVPMPIDLLDES